MRPCFNNIYWSFDLKNLAETPDAASKGALGVFMVSSYSIVMPPIMNVIIIHYNVIMSAVMGNQTG